MEIIEEESVFTIEGTPIEMLDCLLKTCGITNPSWAELKHFVWFLNKQLVDTEESIFCSDLLAGDLPGFKVFVVEFMMQMSNVSSKL